MTVVEQAPTVAPTENFDALLRVIEADLDLALAEAARDRLSDVDRSTRLQRFGARAGLDDIMW